MENDFFERLKNIRLIALDVDGVLTDNGLLITEEGHLLRTMHARDGYATAKALSEGLHVIIITAGNSLGVLTRLENLGVSKVFSQTRNKLQTLRKYCEEQQIQKEEVLYMGDDLLDLEAIRWAGISACPKDAIQEVKEVSDYICTLEGGKGCVREMIELILKHQDKWLNRII